MSVVQKPIAAAVLNLSEKTPVGSVLRTAEWATVPQELRNRAQFSAGVESARVMNRVQGGLLEILSGSRNADGVTTDRSKLIADINRLAVEAGLQPSDPRLRGTVQDITSERRAELMYEQQTGQAYGFSNWKGSQDEDVLNAAPAQELIRSRESRVKRHWIDIWRAAGGRVFPGNPSIGGALQDGASGRCIALKTDPIWERISRFGNPWPPFDFGSGVWVADVLRPEARRLGLLAPAQRLQPNETEFNEKLETSVRDLSPELKDALKSLFGDQVEVDGQTVKWKGGVEANELATANLRQTAGRIFTRSADDFGGVRPEDDGAETAGRVAQITREFSPQWSVEISAVASGRKPFFHEDLGFLSAADLQAFGNQLQKQLPQGIVARFEAGHLYVYNPDLISRFADPGQPLFPQIVAHRDDGKWLGYGTNWHDTADFVRVFIEDSAGNRVAGFGAPADKAELYGAARAQDWVDATGQAYSYVIIPRGGGA